MRSHYIPQFVIKEFAGKDGNVAIYDNNTSRVRRDSPDNVFVIKDWYSDEIENKLAAIEGKISPVVRAVLKACREGASLTVAAKAVLNCFRYFLLIQLLRTPHAKRISIAGIGTSEELYEKLENVGFDMSKRNLQNIKDIEKQARTDAERTRRSKLWSRIVEDFLTNPSNVMPRVVKAIERKGVLLAQTKASSFVLGDCGAVSTAGGGVDLTHPSREIYFPLSPDIAVSLGGDKDQIMQLTIDTSVVRKANLSTMRNSEYVISRSQRLLRSLADPR